MYTLSVDCNFNSMFVICFYDTIVLFYCIHLVYENKTYIYIIVDFENKIVKGFDLFMYNPFSPSFTTMSNISFSRTCDFTIITVLSAHLKQFDKGVIRSRILISLALRLVHNIFLYL